jgi:hypothetical protein
MTIAELGDVIWGKLEFGFDIVLPLVAIWALYKSMREARKKSLNDSVRSALISNLNILINKVAEHYVTNVVESCQAYEKRIDRLIKGEDQDKKARFEKAIKAIADDIGTYIGYLDDYAETARKNIDDFYNMTQSSRYSIFPLLSVIGAKKYIEEFEKETDQILEMHNEIAQSIPIAKHLVNEGKTDDAARFIFQLSSECQRARIECKEVCAFLSALIEQVISSNDPASFESNLEYYKTTVMKCESTIR